MPESQYTIEILLRGLNILTLFSHDNPALSLTEITAQTGLNKTSVFRLLNTLEKAGYLVRDTSTRRYYPGINVLRLGFSAITSLDFRKVAHPFLEQLSQQVNETVSMSILDDMEVVYIDRVRNQQIMGVLLGLGSRLPANCSSMGKVILSHLPFEEVTRRLENKPLTLLTFKSLPNPADLKAELVCIRQQGYAVNDEEIEIGLRAVAAPIMDHNNQVVAAINITGLAARISLERIKGELAEAVCKTAYQISQALGYEVS